jgi:type VI protein secretion system component VasK
VVRALTGSQATTGQQAQSQTATTTLLNDATQKGLQTAIDNLFAGLGSDRASIESGMGKMNEFDPVAYVNGIMQAARSDASSNLDQSLNTMFSNVGGTEGTNSMAALLSNRARNATAANLAGINSQAQAAAGDQVRQNFTAGQGAMANFRELLPQLASILKGATATTDMSSVLQTIQNVLTTGQSATQTQEASNQQATSNTQTLEQLLSNVLSSLTGTEQTNANESQKTKASGMNAGATLSFGSK